MSDYVPKVDSVGAFVGALHTLCVCVLVKYAPKQLTALHEVVTLYNIPGLLSRKAFCHSNGPLNKSIKFKSVLWLPHVFD